MSIKIILLFLALCAMCVSTFAADVIDEAPVVTAQPSNESDGSPDQTAESGIASNIATEALSNEQRLTRLEQQIANQSAYVAQIQNLQHQVQDLQGRLDEANHQIQVLQQANTKKVAVNTIKTIEPEKTTLETTTPMEITTPAPANNLLQEQDIYEKAYQYINKKDYPQAITAMNSYIEQFPRGQYAGNAHYWLGELYVLQHKPDNARGEFKMVIDKFPNNAKAQLATKRLREIDVKSHVKH